MTLRAVPCLVACVLLASCAASGPAEGTRAPSFAASNTEGGVVSLQDLEGQVVVMDFWATWCGPCRQASPLIQQLADQWANDDRVTVIAIHADDPDGVREHPADYMAAHEYTYPIIPDGRTIAMAYHVTALPTIVIVDADGTVIHTQTGMTSSDVRRITDMVQDALD